MDYQKLHTYTLEKLFGPMKGHIIRQDDKIRIIHLRDKKGVSKTLAVVRFLNIENKALKLAHKKIITGSLLGKTLYDSDIDFDKEFLGTIHVKLPNWLMKEFNTQQNSSIVQYSRVTVCDDSLLNKNFIYSELIEILPPELKDIFTNKTKAITKVDENLLSLLKEVDLKELKAKNKND